MSDLNHLIDTFQKEAAQTRRGHASKQKQQTAQSRQRVGVWVDTHLAAVLRENQGRTSIELDPLDSARSFHEDDAHMLAGAIRQIVGDRLTVTVNKQATCSYGDDSFRKLNHVIITA